MLSFIFMVAASALACNADLLASQQGSFNKYFFFSREYSREPVELDAANVNATTVALFGTRNTTIIVHGHEGSAFTSLNPTVKDAALISLDINVIVVDWSVYASQSYSNAVGAVPSVGKNLAAFINELVNTSAVTLSTLHLIGFDLGAHAVGFAGRGLVSQAARITGLNPSRKQWDANSPRLSFRDAEYVEVIHTDGIGLISYGIGDAIGHVDFYPNGGTGQPGCFLNNYCSHNRAWDLMAASFTHNRFVGNWCGNWHQVTVNSCRGYQLTMGNNEFNKIGTGMFRVNTRRTFPFA